MDILCTILAVFAILILSAIALLLFLKVRIEFEVIKNKGEKLKKDLTIRILGFGISQNDLSKKQKKIKKPKKQKQQDTEKEDKKLLEKIKDFTRTFSILKEVYSKNRFFIKKRLVLENTEAVIKFGLFDAMITGIATGAVWSLLYQLLAFLSCIGTVKNHKFDVEPVYNETGFCIYTKGIISFRLINIIVIAVKVFVTYLLVKRKRIKNLR